MTHRINWIIIIILLFSLWPIFSLEVSMIPLIVIDFSVENIKGINDILLNLSYGYIAGVIMYFFTVVIPRKNLRKKQMSLLYDYIDDFYRQSMYLYSKFCAGVFDNDDSVIKYRNNYVEIAKYIPQVRHSNKARYDCLLKISELKTSFILTIIHYKEYFSDSQFVLFSKIRRVEFDKIVLSYKDEKLDSGEGNDVLEFLYTVTEPLAKLITDIQLKK